MKPEQEEKLDKAIVQSSDSLAKIEAVDRKLESLESGLKELADAFKQFTEGFAKSFGESKRVARTSVAVSKEEDGNGNRNGKGAGEGARIHGRQGDAGAGFLEAMKTAHANPFRGAAR